ncbi:MAG: FtsQ-type POTRA domain-containing protein [Thermoactinomyces sp.]
MVDEQIPPFRNRVGKKRSPSPWIYAFIFLFFTGTLFAIFLRSPLSKIEKIEVTGNRLVPAGEILARAQLKKGVSFFGVQTGDVVERLSALPEIEQVKVDKSFPDKVLISIREKELAAWLETRGQKRVPILSDGTILSHRLSAFPQNRIVFTDWNHSDPNLKPAVQEIVKLPETVKRSVRKVKPVPDHKDQVEIWTDRQHRIFVRVEDLSQKMSYYPSFFNHPRGTLFLLESIWFIPDTPERAS